ncbi:MAG TPA: MFS transporter, partial [Pedomonas sp.]|nr:MFS transporter [Pedomonas sp.]
MTSTVAGDQAKRTGMIAPLIVGAAGFMQTFDSSAITVALPPMAVDFGVPALSLNLVITAYLIGATAFLPLCGWAADRFGARRIFLFAIAGFGLTSLACALSSSLPVLIAARVVQGCMGALLIP